MKYKLFVLGTTLIAATAFGQGEVSTARAAKIKVVTDGNTDEWQKPFNFFDNSTALYFSIANDGENLYLCFETADPYAQLKLIKTGMIVTISTKGKNKKNAVISFPIPDKNAAKENPNPAADMITLRTDFMLNQTVIFTEGFDSLNGTLPINSGRIAVGVNWDSEKNMVLEYKIAFKEIFGSGFDLNKYNDFLTLKVDIAGFPNKQVTLQAPSNLSQRNTTLTGQNLATPNNGMNQNGIFDNSATPGSQPPADNNSFDDLTKETSPEFIFLHQSGNLKQKFFLNR